MSQPISTPFDTIESAQDFIRVLAETVAEAKLEVESDLARESGSEPQRRQDALRIAVYNLSKLEQHMASSRRILNDLRTLRRLLFAERKFHHVKAIGSTSVAQQEALPSVVAAITSNGRMPLGGTTVPQSSRPAA